MTKAGARLMPDSPACDQRRRRGNRLDDFDVDDERPSLWSSSLCAEFLHVHSRARARCRPLRAPRGSQVSAFGTRRVCRSAPQVSGGQALGQDAERPGGANSASHALPHISNHRNSVSEDPWMNPSARSAPLSITPAARDRIISSRSDQAFAETKRRISALAYIVPGVAALPRDRARPRLEHAS